MTKTIGIVGGGQLGRMLVDAAHALDFKVTVLDPTPSSPAGQVADKQIIGDFTKADKIVELACESDYLTFEIESANADVLKALALTGTTTNPTGETLLTIKDKLRQKNFLRKNNIPAPDFIEISDARDAIQAGEKFGYPYMLKSRCGAYDGRGNSLVKNESDIERALKKLEDKYLYAEKLVPFIKELSVVGVRTMSGDIKTYPTTETIHKHHICHTTITPAEISTASDTEAQELAKKTLKLFTGAGVFAVEMFLTRQGHIFINEIAPRVHNSGHHSIESSLTSQFEQHIRAITDMELGETTLTAPAAVMINILGERSGEAKPKGITEAESIEGVAVHMYGKKEVRIERKMGHITAAANTVEEALAKAHKAQELISL